MFSRFFSASPMGAFLRCILFLCVAACGGDNGGSDTSSVSDTSPLFPDASIAACPEAEAAMAADPCLLCVCADDGAPICEPVAIGTNCATDDCCVLDGSCQPCDGVDCLDSGLSCTGPSVKTCGGELVSCIDVISECQDGECVCSESVSEDGAECVADANACTVGDSCEGGVCIQGDAASLDDENPCTSGLCVKGEVQQQLVTGQCSDGNLCTIGDECKLGQCVSDELKECPLTACANTAFCDPDTGACNWEFKADGEACEFEGGCGGLGTCLGGECLSHTADEICDGIDNDCDNQTDEGISDLVCGTGDCQQILPACVGGIAQSCPEISSSDEVCDGIDNDCDGETDENLSQACQTACGSGVEICTGGSWVDCSALAPQAEICDWLDNDCNGQTDDGLGTKSCGLPGCETTVQACVNGVEQECVPTGGQPETCDGFDNDCDGWADEDGCYPAGTCDINIDIVCTPEKAHPAEYRVIGLNVPQGILSYNLVPGELLVNWCLNDTGNNHFPLSAPSGCIQATWEIGLCLVPDGWVPTTCEKTECYSCP